MTLASKVLVAALAAGALAQSALKIQVTKDTTHAIPSTLYGYMWEDINHSGDGGLYGELLQNRAFQAVSPHTSEALTAWSAYRGATIDVTNNTPGVSTALPNSLQVAVPTGVTGSVGFQNSGYWGKLWIKVQSGWKYTGSLYAKSDSYTGSVTVSLVSESGTTYATKTLKGVSSSWKKFTFEFKPTKSAPNNNNFFRVTVDGSSAAGKNIYFGLLSLFPPTYRNRPNGMRVDLAEALDATKPGVWRFPGGNNLEGHAIDRRWKWNETIGPIENRPGRFADWGYPNTDGLGLMEYLNWAEDLGAEPILGVWAGLSIGDYADLSTFPVVPEAEIQPYVQEVINEIHFITGDAKTNEWAKLRAQYGHPEPYKLKYIEIGNEDFFGVDTYVKYRWRAFVTGLKAAFPDSGFEYLATSLPDTALDPAYTYLDFHQYNTPEWFIERALQYDTYPRNGTHLFIGEYAVTSTNSSCLLGEFSCGRLEYPTLQGAVAEAAYMTGLERNSDVIFASAYAPSLQHINGWQWTPDIITFDAGDIVKSASYYAQHMFSTNLGTHVIKTSPAPSAGVPLHWVASHDTKNKIVYLKAANTANSSFIASFAFGFPLAGRSSSITVLSAPMANVSNTLTTTNAVLPKTTSLKVASGSTVLNYTFPAYSVAVFKLPVNW
ncbi:Alpha-L-arabinofuranosidase C-terminus, partial [Rhizoctonia solani]